MIYRIHEEVETFNTTKKISSGDSTTDNLGNAMYAGSDKLSFPSGNAFESMARTNPEYFNNAKLKELKASKNLVDDFNQYFKSIIMGDVKKHKDKYGEFYIPLGSNDDSSEFNTAIHRVLLTQYNLLSNFVTQDVAIKCVTEEFIPESLTEDGCRALINIRLQNSKILTDSLTKMLRHNYQALGISSAEARHLLFELTQDSTNSKAMEKIKELLKDPNKLQKFRMGENNYDFRSIGGACIFLSEDPSIQFSQHPSKRLADIFKYDAIVTAHGGYSPIGSGGVIKRVRDGKSRNWVCQPVSTLHQSNLTSIVDILRALKKEGFKNVYVGACNPGSVQLPNDIIMDKSFKVSMGMHSVYLESELYDDPQYQNLCAIEEQLTSMCMEYGDNYSGYTLNELYTEIDSINNEYVLNEGVVSALIGFAKKAAQIIMEIWKRIVGFFKSIYQKCFGFIREKFGDKSKNKMKKPIEVNTIAMNGDGTASIVKSTATTPDDITNIIQKSNISINNRIQYHSNKETAYIRKLEQLINSGRLKKDKPKNSTNESTIFESAYFI